MIQDALHLRQPKKNELPWVPRRLTCCVSLISSTVDETPEYGFPGFLMASYGFIFQYESFENCGHLNKLNPKVIFRPQFL